ncbi:MAG: M28 family peptidase [Terriglobales bacterium]
MVAIAVVPLPIPKPILRSLLFVLLASNAIGQAQYRLLDQTKIESRLKSFSRKNEEREAIIKQLFKESGCKVDQLSEQVVRPTLPPNVICVLPGETDGVILVGAHTDKVDQGDGVVDNWSGASLLPSLLYSVNGRKRRHTFVFVGFTGEEKGLLGSDFYVHKLNPEQRSKIEGMVNFDTLGLGPTEVWASHADMPLLNALARIASTMKLPITVMNVDDIGSTDSESFAEFKIPRVTIHSLTESTLPVLHSSRDTIAAIKMGDYYTTYRLMAGYLALLDTQLDVPAR